MENFSKRKFPTFGKGCELEENAYLVCIYIPPSNGESPTDKLLKHFIAYIYIYGMNFSNEIFKLQISI